MLENKNVVLKPALSHDAFWHLQAIGVLPYRPEPPSPSAERDELPIWRRLEGANAVVAIIDTGVSGHPYLFERLEPPYNIDLTGAPTLVMPEQKASRGEFAGMTTEWLSGMGLYRKEETAPFQKVLKDLVEKYERKRTFDYGAPPAANQKFAAHGTSCAGLVAASSKHGPERKVLSRPYYRGVDPNSKIMSITTSFAPNPELLTLAFLLAAKKRADVILFPRGLPREIMNDDPNLDKDHFFEWQALKQTILAVSKIIPIVCAAGNECVDQAIAPACFANDDNGIIGVAAANYFGVRSSYSNFGNGVTITAPSDDAEMFNVDQARLDKTDRFYGEHPYQTFIQNFGLSDVLYGEASIRAIDVPGPFGFTDTANNSIISILIE